MLHRISESESGTDTMPFSVANGDNIACPVVLSPVVLAIRFECIRNMMNNGENGIRLLRPLKSVLHDLLSQDLSWESNLNRRWISDQVALCMFHMEHGNMSDAKNVVENLCAYVNTDPEVLPPTEPVSQNMYYAHRTGVSV